jgi:hypothetical protein
MSTTHRSARRRGPRSAALALLLALPAAGCSAAHGLVTPPVGPSGALERGASRLPSSLQATAPAGTVYIGGADGNVYAFPLGANGTVAPSRTITPHPNQAGSESIDSFAALADGKLAILQSFHAGASGRCRVVVEDANADGSPAAQNVWCDPSATTATAPAGIARNAMGGFDLLYQDNSAFALVLKRFGADGASLTNTLPPIANTVAVATDAGGHDYLLSPNGELRKYKATTTDGNAAQTDDSVPGSSFRTMAVAPDKTVYVAYGDLGSEVIVAVVNGAVTRTIGPFASFDVHSLAVDSLGELYVGLSPIDPNTVAVLRVYAPDANGKPAALRVLRPNPRLACICGVAISE